MNRELQIKLISILLIAKYHHRRQQYLADWARKNPEKVKAKQAKYNKTEKARAKDKRYFERHPERRREQFRRFAQSQKGKACAKRYFSNNKLKCGERVRRYHQQHAVQIRKRLRAYRAANIETFRAKRKARFSKEAAVFRERWKTDPIFRLRHTLRLRIRQAVKERRKDQRALELLGCSIQEFKAYLQSLFTEGMTWQHFLDGKIHLDHKRPIDSFDLTDPEQVKACFRWDNMQPLWWRDNLKKHNKISPEYNNTEPVSL